MAKTYLDAFIDYEKNPSLLYQKSLNLKRVRVLFKLLGLDLKKFKIIHISGTKGKGSTAHFCAHLLAAAGYRTGLYTSPHFYDFRERIRINNEMILKKEAAKIAADIKSCLQKYKLPKELGEFSFFEVSTAMAFKYFLKKNPDYVVLETGMGGRLDATNVAKPLVSIITHIGHDHTQHLGKSLSKIAYEKAGIIKPGVPVISSRQDFRALRVIKAKAKSLKSPLAILGRDFKVSNIRLKKDYTLFDFKLKKTNLKNLKIKLKGKHQVDNAALALAGLITCAGARHAVPLLVKKGLADCQLPGRFEILSKKPLLVCDIAHNPSSFRALAESLKAYFPDKKTILIFGCAKDKDALGMLKTLKPWQVIFTGFDNPRAQDPVYLKELCRSRRGDPTGRPYIADKAPKKALKIAKQMYNEDCLILAAGSIHLAAQIKKYA